jgi:hypothetical protein
MVLYLERVSGALPAMVWTAVPDGQIDLSIEAGPNTPVVGSRMLTAGLAGRTQSGRLAPVARTLAIDSAPASPAKRKRARRLRSGHPICVASTSKVSHHADGCGIGA